MGHHALRLSQILGYFPVPIKNGNRTLLPITSTIIFCLLGVGNIHLFIPYLSEDPSIKGATRGGRQLVTSTYYSTILIKGAVHIFAVVFIRVTLFLNREELSQFYGEFNRLVETFSIFSRKANISEEAKRKTPPAVGNRYDRRLRIELIMLYLLWIAFIGDMWEGYLANPNKGVTLISTLVIVLPPTLGYLHAIFPYLLIFFLNWYLEILCELRASHFTLVDTRIPLYNRLSTNVSSFVRVFGTCIVIDMAHSVMRIVFCAYFVASSASTPFVNVRGMASDVFTVVAYCYLVFTICSKGAQLEGKSGDFIKSCDDEGDQLYGDGRLYFVKSCRPRLTKNYLDTEYFRVNLGLITPIVGTVITNLIVLMQFQNGDKTRVTNCVHNEE
ncbi:hypothetical protein Fcan01_10108 [Folsomia candida]|uniref:Gustatory receptor n=1 Tax=Folsomia candida TaxID=158441 RepID=A0A226EAA4_FOLCA|nr:hypothetical protein Fcan01_10108 [Folsomia candida]